jgi:two-component sensor histidine kinase
MSGPEVALAPHTAVGLSMVFHELATNSAKYGALSVPAGRSKMSWRLGSGDRHPGLRLAR